MYFSGLLVHKIHKLLNKFQVESCFNLYHAKPSSLFPSWREWNKQRSDCQINKIDWWIIFTLQRTTVTKMYNTPRSICKILITHCLQDLVETE